MQADTRSDRAAFPLDARLQNDTRFLADLQLCRLLLMNDSRWPWTILVPRRPNLAELFDLDQAERAVLMEEAAKVGTALKTVTGCEKINIGALGNSVRQFHVHVVARSAGDLNWPGPVWGFGARLPYDPAAAQALSREILKRLS